VRRIILPAVLLLAALFLQLSFINGLHLPGGGVPDLVLVVVAALGLANGSVPGAIGGFAAGLCLDLAPPASGILGEYALVFCLVGWACGRLRGSLARSAWLPIVIAAAAAVAGEVLVAALGLALQPASVTFSSVRQVLPAALLYDIAITPFALYLILLATARLDEEAAAAASAGQARIRRARAQAGAVAVSQAVTARQGLAGSGGSAAGSSVLLGLGGWLAGPPQSRRARRAAARRAPRLGSARAGDGWIGGSSARRAVGDQALSGRSVSTLTGRGAAARLRSGVAGSAAGGQAPRTLAGRPVNLRLAATSRREGLPGVGKRVVLASGLSRSALASLGRRRGRRDGGFRPSALPGGSALAATPQRRPLAPAARIDFGGSGLAGAQSSLATGKRPRFRVARRRDGVIGGGMLTRFTSRSAATPRFRVHATVSPAYIGSSGGSGAPSLQAYRPARPQRLRMRARRGDGMVGGGLGSGPKLAGTRPSTPRFRSGSLASARPISGKRPKFRHRRWHLTSRLRRPDGRLRLWPLGRSGGLR
jgi:rod shape-determining protein MreD